MTKVRKINSEKTYGAKTKGNTIVNQGNRLTLMGLAAISFGLFTGFSECAESSANKAEKRPLNVLFIAVDDLRADNMGCYGDLIAITPNIDRLAAAGTVFDRAYCQQAVCNPSRASLMTGRRPNSTKVWNLATHFRKALPDVITLPQHFKKHGYHTQMVGKIYHDPAWAQDAISWSTDETLEVTGAAGKYVLEENLNRGKSWKATATERADVPDTAYIDGKVSAAAVDILGEIKDKPFFLAVGFRRPHLPFSAPSKYWEMYDRDSIPVSDVQAPENAPDIALHKSTELRGYTDVPSEGPIELEKRRELLHGYYASTTYMDAQVGKLLDELDRLNLLDHTIVVLWSDHGYHLGEHDLWGKTSNFEFDTRVPLIISAPGQQRKSVKSAALVELVDLYPTLVDLAGLPLAVGLEGISISPLLDNPDLPWKEAAFSQFPRPFPGKGQSEIMGYSVRTDRYRYTEWQQIADGEVVGRELYDHNTDSMETENIVQKEEHAADVEELAVMLRQVF